MEGEQIRTMAGLTDPLLDYWVREWKTLHATKILRDDRIVFDRVASWVAINGGSYAETHLTYYFWQALNPVLDRLAREAEEAWKGSTSA